MLKNTQTSNLNHQKMKERGRLVHQFGIQVIQYSCSFLFSFASTKTERYYMLLYTSAKCISVEVKQFEKS
jgi:hypothetical protein